MILTAGQACFLYGWLGAKYNLLWEDIIQSNTIDFQKLIKANLTLDQVYQIQPDIKKWIKHNKISKDNLFDVYEKWDCDVIKDFSLDIGDLINPRFSVEVLKKIGVNYQKLCDMGLTSENMRLFTHITLSGWSQMGLTRSTAATIPENHLLFCFGMKKQDVLYCLTT
jgi:hypothetical protein